MRQRLIAALVGLLLAASPVVAADAALTETEVWQLRALEAERRVLEQAHIIKAGELNAAIEAAAKRVNVDPMKYNPDLVSKVWRVKP